MTRPAHGGPPAPDFRVLFESAPGLYLVLTTDFTIVAVSDAYLHATMTRRAEILGHGLFEVFPDNPGDTKATGVANLRASLERVLAHRRPDAMAVQKYDIRRPESEGGGFEERHWSPVNSPVFGRDGEITYIIHRVEDVTEFVRLKQQDREQHKIADELRTRAGTMEVEIYRRAQEIQETNRQLRDLQAELEQRVRQRTAELEDMNQRLRSEMDERIRVDEALRDSEARYRLLFSANPQPMWVYDRQTLRFLAVNQAAVQLYGYSADEFLEMTIKDVRPKEDVPALLEGLAKDRPELNTPHEWRHLRKDGGVITVDITSHTLEFGGRDAVLVLASDVTGRKHLEAQLRQSQKMEAIGQLAGGVAHDFNNLLTAILGYSQLTRARFRADDPATRDLEGVEKAANRAASLTRQLLAFSRQQVLQPQVLDLNAVITDIDRMLRRLIGADVELVTAPSPTLGQVKADPGQIEQVVMNLVVNARDAMPHGGQLTIETGNIELDEAYVGERIDLSAGRYVMLAVSDTGCGMDAATKARVFEPFFTTKEVGKGTGLGLSTVHGIVKQSDGHIEIYSEVGRGTTIKIYLPRVDGVVEQLHRETLVQPMRGSETILLVEDEDLVRAVVQQTLQGHGYTVLVAHNGEDALHLCERGEIPIDLVLTDIVMPKMGGTTLVESLGILQPSLKVLYMSGYTDRAVTRQGLLSPATAFLQKPFMPEALLRKVRRVLDTDNRAAA